MRKRKYTSLAETQVTIPNTAPPDTELPIPVIHNIVSTAQIKSNCAVLDLDKICEILPGSSFDRTKFAAMTIRLANPNCTILLFSSGKLVVTGGKTWYESILSCLYIREFLQTHLVGFDFRLKSCDNQNIVAHVELFKGDTARYLDLDAMYTHLNMQCTYQKHMFPGLIFRPTSSPIVLLCFFSGKIVITGGRSYDDVFEGWQRLWPVVARFVRGSQSARPTALRILDSGCSSEPHTQ